MRNFKPLCRTTEEGKSRFSSVAPAAELFRMYVKSAHRANIWAYVEKKNPLTCDGLILAVLRFLDLSGKNVTPLSSGFF